MTIGERIKKLRMKSGISQVDFADKINVSKQTLYKYENNIITNIPIDKIEAVAKLCNVSPSYVMGWDETPPDFHVFDIVLMGTEWLYDTLSHCAENQDCPLTKDERSSKWNYGTSYDACKNCDYNTNYYYLNNREKYYKFEENEFNELVSCLKPYLLFRINEAISKKTALSPLEYFVTEGLVHFDKSDEIYKHLEEKYKELEVIKKYDNNVIK